MHVLFTCHTAYQLSNATIFSILCRTPKKLYLWKYLILRKKLYLPTIHVYQEGKPQTHVIQKVCVLEALALNIIFGTAKLQQSNYLLSSGQNPAVDSQAEDAISF